MLDEKTYTQAQVDEMMKGALSQEKVDNIVQERLAREKAKYSDYEDLKKFRTEHEKKLEEATQKELEAKKEYDKLKEGWANKEHELQGIVTKKENEISDMKITNALMAEIVKQNAFPEETIALIKSQAVFDKENNIRIKGRDANGLEIMETVEEGIKKFLTQRPHLVRATQRAGGGTGGGNPSSGAGAGAEDLNTLNAELLQAQNRGDFKKANEVSIKIRAILGAQKAQL